MQDVFFWTIGPEFVLFKFFSDTTFFLKVAENYHLRIWYCVIKEAKRLIQDSCYFSCVLIICPLKAIFISYIFTNANMEIKIKFTVRCTDK